MDTLALNVPILKFDKKWNVKGIRGIQAQGCRPEFLKLFSNRSQMILHNISAKLKRLSGRCCF